MYKNQCSQGIFHRSVLFTALAAAGLSSGAQAADARAANEQLTVADTHSEPQMVVTAPRQVKEAGSQTTLTAAEMQKKGLTTSAR